MKKGIMVLAIFLCIMISVPLTNARVDARFIITDEDGKQIYTKTPDNTIIYGNVLVGQTVIFNASDSNSAYPIDRYHWDFDGDGSYDEVTNVSTITHVYDKQGTYNVTLLAVASSAPPSGDGDTVTRTVVVVNSFIAPFASMEITRIGADDTGVSFFFNASGSHDEDGYIKYYRWDFYGNGNYYVGRNEMVWKYTKNGYYTPTLEVIDYDGMNDTITRVIRVDELTGELNETTTRITIENKCGHTIAVSVKLNNNEIFNVTVNKKYVINASACPALNEIEVSSEGKYALFLFKGTDGIRVAISSDSISLPSHKTPGFELLFLLAGLVAIMLKRMRM